MQKSVLRSLALLFTLALMVGSFFVWGGNSDSRALAAPSRQAPEPEQPPSARRGAPLYRENCAPCHGETGLGDGPAIAQFNSPAAALANPDVARPVTPAEWFLVVKEGRMDRFMPPWANRLSDQEIWDVVAYAFTLHSAPTEAADGMVVWSENCAACHGDTAAGDGSQAMAAGLEMADLSNPTNVANSSLDDWFQAVSAGRGSMPAFGDQLDEADIWAALAYARSQAFQPVIPLSVPTGEGRISGMVVNGTPGGGAVAGLPVRLRVFQHFDELQSQQGVTAADGSFAFDNLPTEPNFFYFAEVAFGDVPLSSDLIAFEEGQTEQTVTVTVWESSTVPGDISIEVGRWFVETREGALLVVEVYLVNHVGDRIYVGSEEIAEGKQAVLTFPVPSGIASLEIEGGEVGDRYHYAEDRVIDTEPLAPGQSQVVIQYLLPYSGSRAELTHALAYPAQEFSALVAEGPRVRPDGLEDRGVQQMADRTFGEYGTTDLPAGEAIGLRLSGLDRSSSAATGSNAVLAYHPALLAGIGVLALVAIMGLLAVPFLAKGNRAKGPSAAGTQDLADRRQRLVEAIAALDDAYAVGELEETGYREERQRLKRTLVATTRQMESEADGQVPS